MSASFRSIPSSAWRSSPSSGRSEGPAAWACSWAGGSSSKRCGFLAAPEVLQPFRRVERRQVQPVAREAHLLEQRLAIPGVRERGRAASRQDAEAGPGAAEEVEGDVHGAAVDALSDLGLDQVEGRRFRGARAKQPLVEAQPVVAGSRNHLEEAPRRLAPAGAKRAVGGIADVPRVAVGSHRLEELAQGVPLLVTDELIEDDAVERGIDPPRVQPGELVGAERADTRQVEVFLEVEAQLGARHACDVRRVPQALLVPGLAAALVLLAASAVAWIVASHARDGPAPRAGALGVVVVQALEQGRADVLQEPVRPFVSDRAQPSRGQSLDQGGELVVSEHGRGGGQEGLHLEPARFAREHARLAHELAAVSIDRALAAPVCGEEERRGLALPRQSAVHDRTDERPDDVTLHAPRQLADDTRVREETRALDQVTGVHGRAGMEGGERQGGEGTREVALDALLEQVVHRRCVAGDLAGQRLDRLSREAGRLGPEDQGVRVFRVPHRLRPIGHPPGRDDDLIPEAAARGASVLLWPVKRGVPSVVVSVAGRGGACVLRSGRG